MPASKEYIKALQIKRLEQSRPKVKLPKPATPEATNLSYLFKDLEIAKSSTADVITPLAVTTTTLDDGRIYLKDAIKYFGWNEFTCLDFQVEVGHQEIDGKYSGVSTAREQRQFIIDPDSVRSLPTFHWFVSLGQKVSHLYVPPNDL